MQEATDTDDPSDTPAPASAERQRRRRRELIYGALGLVLGFVILPLLIFMVGTLLLGPYAGGQSIAVFFQEFFVNLAHGVLRTWTIALSPYLLFWFLRLCLRRYNFAGKPRSDPPPEEPTPKLSAQGAAETRRREPFISA